MIYSQHDCEFGEDEEFVYGQEVWRQSTRLTELNITAFRSGVYLIDYWREDVLLSTSKYIQL